MIAEALDTIKQRIVAAEARSGRTDQVLLLAVTKNHPVSAVEEAVAAGVTAVGENRVQEAKQKIEQYHGTSVEWHLIGHLQVNKARQAVPLFDLIHSVDSGKLLEEIEKVAAKHDKIQRILLQVNVAGEASKSGMTVEEFPTLLNLAGTYPHIMVEGLMCIAPAAENIEDVRPVFRVASFLFEDMKKYFPKGQIKYLSMGMTHDFEIAIEEGANIVRVGTAIFGERDYGKP